MQAIARLNKAWLAYVRFFRRKHEAYWTIGEVIATIIVISSARAIGDASIPFVGLLIISWIWWIMAVVIDI